MTTTPNTPTAWAPHFIAPLGVPRRWPQCLAFYGLPHTSPSFRARWAGDPAAKGKTPGRCKAQAAWLARQYAQAAA